MMLLNSVVDFETQTRFMRQWQSGHQDTEDDKAWNLASMRFAEMG